METNEKNGVKIAGLDAYNLLDESPRGRLKAWDAFHEAYRKAFLAYQGGGKKEPEVALKYKGAYWNFKNINHRCAMDLIIYCDEVLTEDKASAYFSEIEPGRAINKNIFAKAAAMLKKG